MLDTEFFSRVLGPILVLLGVAILTQPARFKKIFEELKKNRPLAMFAAYVDLVFGLVVVGSHNIWVLATPLIITLVGWFMVVCGALYVVLPQETTDFFFDFYLSRKLFLADAAACLIMGLLLLFA